MGNKYITPTYLNILFSDDRAVTIVWTSLSVTISFYPRAVLVHNDPYISVIGHIKF